MSEDEENIDENYPNWDFDEEMEDNGE